MFSVQFNIAMPTKTRQLWDPDQKIWLPGYHDGMNYPYKSWSCRNLKNHWIYVSNPHFGWTSTECRQIYHTLILYARWFVMLHMILLNLTVLYKTCSWFRQKKNNDNQKYQSIVFVKHFFLKTFLHVFFCRRRHSQDAPPRSWSFWAPKKFTTKPPRAPFEFKWICWRFIDFVLVTEVFVDF